MDPIQLLARATIFEGLTGAELEPLRPAARTRNFERGSYLFHEGDPAAHLYVVIHGLVKIARIGEGGGEVVFAIAGPDEVFGEMTLFEEESQRTADAQALEPTECIVVAKDPLLRFLSTKPALLIRIVAMLSDYIKRKDVAMTDVAFLDVPGRVAHKLVELADARGRPAQDGIVIDVPLKQRTLAGMVGASRENVNRTLRRFSTLGYIRLEGGTITVLNRAQLQRRASSHM